jgi:hypothetical protein
MPSGPMPGVIRLKPLSLSESGLGRILHGSDGVAAGGIRKSGTCWLFPPAFPMISEWSCAKADREQKHKATRRTRLQDIESSQFEIISPLPKNPDDSTNRCNQALSQACAVCSPRSGSVSAMGMFRQPSNKGALSVLPFLCSPESTCKIRPQSEQNGVEYRLYHFGCIWVRQV